MTHDPDWERLARRTASDYIAHLGMFIREDCSHASELLTSNQIHEEDLKRIEQRMDTIDHVLKNYAYPIVENTEFGAEE